jgi:hypothetical protein
MSHSQKLAMTQSQRCRNWQKFSKVSKAFSAGTCSSTNQGRRKQTTCSTGPTNLNLSNEAQLSNQVTTTNHRQSITQLTITSEGGHTSGKACRISKGAGTDTQPFSQKFVTRRLLGYGNCQSGNCIGHQSLEHHSFGKHCCTPNHGQINGIYGTQRTQSSSLFGKEDLVTRWASLPRHPRKSRNQHVIFY